MWLELSGELFYFGSGGIVGVVEIADKAFLSNKTIYNTELLLSNGKNVRVTETISEIKLKLKGEVSSEKSNCSNCSCS